MADFRPRKADFLFEGAEFRLNQSPKGYMWSAIPVALLCMIENWSERKQGSGTEGDKVL